MKREKLPLLSKSGNWECFDQSCVNRPESCIEPCISCFYLTNCMEYVWKSSIWLWISILFSKSYKNTIDQRHTDWGQLKCQLLLVIHLIIFIDNLNLIVVFLVGRVTVVKIMKTMIYQSTGLQERKDDIINHLYINFRALMQYLRGVFVLSISLDDNYL